MHVQHQSLLASRLASFLAGRLRAGYLVDFATWFTSAVVLACPLAIAVFIRTADLVVISILSYSATHSVTVFRSITAADMYKIQVRVAGSKV